MAQNAISNVRQVEAENIKGKVNESKESIRDTVYKVSAAVSNAILVTLAL